MNGIVYSIDGQLFDSRLRIMKKLQSVVSPVPNAKEDQSDYYMTSGLFGNYVDLEGVFKNEFQLVRRYREMHYIQKWMVQLKMLYKKQ